MTARLLTPTQIIRGGMYIVIQSVEGATLTCGADTYTLTSGETYHAFSVTAGTYTCTANKTDYYEASASVTITSGVEVVSLNPIFLPATYQQVEYIRGNGNQYIVTNTTFADNQTVYCKFRIVNNNSLVRIYDARNESGASALYRTNDGSAITYCVRNYADYYAEAQTPTISLNTVYQFTSTPDNNVTINDVIYSNSATYGGAGGTAYFNIFRRAGENTTGLQGDIFSFSITQSGSKIIDLIPCYRKSDSVAGMYDKVSNTLLTNSGSGSFTVGADVN